MKLAFIYKQKKIFKYIHYHLDNFISFPLIYRFVGNRCVLTKLHTKNWKHRSRWTVTLTSAEWPFYSLTHSWSSVRWSPWSHMLHLQTQSIGKTVDIDSFPNTFVSLLRYSRKSFNLWLIEETNQNVCCSQGYHQRCDSSSTVFFLKQNHNSYCVASETKNNN